MVDGRSGIIAVRGKINVILNLSSCCEEISRQNCLWRHSPAHGPDASIVGGKLNNGVQEEIKVHVASKGRSAEWDTIINHTVYNPVEKMETIIIVFKWVEIHDKENQL